MDFSGKELVRGEPDASSFPSGGLRATFEARGYTAWDPTAFAFIKDGSALHPDGVLLLRRRGAGQEDPAAALAWRRLAREAAAAAAAFRQPEADVSKVTPQVGPEQEYFLIDSELYYSSARTCGCRGRTLFGSQAAQGPGAGGPLLRRHPPRVAAFMKELDEELWKLGVLCQDQAQRGRPRPARDGSHLLRRQRRHRPEPARHGDDEERRRATTAWSACCMKSPLPASTAPASTTTGRSRPTRARTCSPPAKRPARTPQFLRFPRRLYQGRGRVSGAAALLRRLRPATITVWARSEAPPAIISIFLGDRAAEHRRYGHRR